MTTKAILLDIEGTTTPIDFVHNTLFPFAKARVAGFIQENLDGLKFELGQLTAEHEADPDYNGQLRPDSANSVSDYLKHLIEQDRKSTPLKSIQGMIWQRGFESGDLVSVVYDDVPAALRRWKDAGTPVAVFSSGSVLAQRMIFKYSDQGDLTQLIDAYFDTNTGGKQEAESYAKIAAELKAEAGDVLFASDAPAELDAARTAGMQTVLCMRPGNEEITEDPSHRTIESFDSLD